MKKYLLIILILFSTVVMANDDFKASVTVGYGTNDSVYKVKNITVFLYL